MDAAHKLTKTAGLLLLIALFMAVPGWAQPVLTVQSNVSLSGNSNSQTVNVTSSTATQITFSAGHPDYSSDPATNGIWLTVVQNGTTTPTTLTFTAFQTAGLSQGAHTATVTLTPDPATGAGAAPQTVTVTYTSGNSGGGGGNLTAFPNPVNVSASSGNSFSTNVSITTTSTTAITLGLTAATTTGNSSWLTAAFVGSSTVVQGSPATIQITANAFNLANTTYTGTVTVTPISPAGTALSIPVNFTVGGSSGNGSWTASPSSIPFSFTTGSGSFPSTLFSVSTSSGYTTYSASSNANWLLVAGSQSISGLAVGAQYLASLGSAANNLTTGSYNGTITITDPVGVTQTTIFVTLSVNGAGGGSGGWTVTPSVIPFSFNTNSGIFPSSSVSVTTTSGLTTYNASSDSSWLLIAGSQSISGLAVGASYSVSVGGTANSLTTGSYTGHISIRDPNGNLQGTLTVNLSVNGANTSGLTVTPNPLSLTSAVNGVQQNPMVSIFSSSGGTLSVSGNLQSWISDQLPSNTTVAPGGTTSITINANPAGLSAGTYGQLLTITVGSQSTTLSVNLTVGSSSGGGGGSVLPTSLSFTYELGTLPSTIAQQKILIPGGNWTSNITTTSGGNWLQLSPTNGISVPDSTSSPTAFIAPTGLTAGSYAGNIAITTGGGVQNVSVSLTVTTAPALVPTPGSLVFVAQTGTTTPSQAVFFSATDQSVGTPNITATSNNTWITVSATPSSMAVFVDPTGMAAGLYSGSITVIQSGVANTPYTYPVLMVVNGGGGSSGPLNFNPTSLSFTSNNGTITPSSTTLTVSANVSTNFTYTSSVFGGLSNWINISPANSGSGVTTTNLSVSVNPSGLATGSYSGTITFSAGGFTQTVPVNLSVTGSGGGTAVTVNPTSLTYSAQAGATSLPVQSITVSSASGSAPATFTVTPTTTSGGTWLSTSANASNSTPATLNVTANPSGLAAGTYNGNLAVQPTSGAVVNVAVTLTIAAAPSVAATPTSLTFNYRAGDTAPPAQQVSVTGAGLAYTATAASTGNWLSATPASGTAPGTVNVSVNGTGLTPGNYTGTVTIAGTNGATGSTTVNVTLSVTAPLPTITKVTNAASYATESLSPGEIITLFAGDPAHPIGPGTPVGLTVDSSTGLVSTSIGGVQVLINGFASPMIYASSTQVSAVVPYQLAQFTAATVLVKYLGQTSNGVTMNMATTAPGLFTANSSGTGPGAILNSNNSVNSPANPATRGDVVVVYMTGEGQTSPAGVTGKVTTVSSTPPLTPAPLLPVSITVGGQGANYTFAGQAPGFVSGVMQLNVQLPTNIGAGDQEILVTVGGNQSQRGVTVSVK